MNSITRRIGLGTVARYSAGPTVLGFRESARPTDSATPIRRSIACSALPGNGAAERLDRRLQRREEVLGVEWSDQLVALGWEEADAKPSSSPMPATVAAEPAADQRPLRAALGQPLLTEP